MKHYGDITKIDGSKVPTVNIITGGSPCKDLSIAGQRKGLVGERSGLFMEQIRIVKEMRKENVRKSNVNSGLRFMVWENVPGAFSSNGGEDFRAAVYNTVVRRLTPLECERLQGFPDGWTDIGDWIDTKGKKHKLSDTPRYKALGNSLALPFWEWLARRMVDVLRKDGIESPTMASLFDGIGGFPLVYSRAGCLPVWASEIEEFPIAVTKYHFGGE